MSGIPHQPTVPGEQTSSVPPRGSSASQLPLALFDPTAVALLYDHLLNGVTYVRVLFDGEAPVDFLHLYCNPAFIQQTQRQVVGKLGSAVLPELKNADRQMLDACGRVARGGKPESFCHRFGGIEQWFELSLFSPHPGHVMVVFNMITEQVAKSLSLKEHHRWWVAALEATSAAVFVCDRHGDVTEVNDAFVRYHRFRHRAECLLYRQDYEEFFEVRTLDGVLLAPEDWPVMRALRGERAAGMHFRLRRLDSDEQWVGSYDFAPISNEAGGLLGAIVVARDVTAERARQFELQSAYEELAEMKRALAAVGIAVYRVDSHSGQYLEVDALMRRRLGYSVDEIRRMLPWDINVATSGEHLPEVMTTLRRKGNLRLEAVHRSKTGEDIPVEILLYHRPPQAGAPDHALAFARDITARRKREAALEQLRQETQRLQEAAVASSTGLAVAHELNQPLMAASLSTATALRLLDQLGNASARLRETLELADRNVQRACEVVRDLVAFLGKRQASRQTLDMNELVVSAVRRAERKLAGSHLLSACLAGEAQWVRGNEVQLMKILENLIQNGLDAMTERPTPGAIDVRVESAADGASVRVSVLDQGIGLAPDELQQAFEPFYTTKATGLGMGLAICRSLAEDHQGRLWAESTPGEGATFHLVLPAVAPMSPLPSTRPRLNPGRARSGTT